MNRAMALKQEYIESNIKKHEPSIKWEEVRKRLFDKDPEFESAVNDLEPEYEIVMQIIKARIEQNLSQKELAEKVGTKQAHISRLESGEYNPSLKFLKKIAKGLGKELHITFR
jgi:ribosome-binding protein aMBF1 (putative translation factor)